MDDQKILEISSLQRQLHQEQLNASYSQKKIDELQAQLQYEKDSFERFLITIGKESVIKDINEYEGLAPIKFDRLW